MNNELLERLKAVFASGSLEEKRDILSEIPHEPLPGLVDLLAEILNNETDRAVKTRILLLFEYLLAFGDAEVVESMLRSSDPFVRNGAIDLIKRVHRDWYPLLQKLANDPDKDMRKFIIDALTNDDSPVARQILRNALADDDVNIVYTAIEQLGGIRDKESAVRIEKILSASDHPMVLCTALEALTKIGICQNRDMILERFTRHAESLFYFPLIKFIGRFGDSQQFDFLEKLLDSDWDTYAKEIIDAVAAIVRHHHLDSLPAGLHGKLQQKAREPGNTTNRYAIMQLLSSLTNRNALEDARKMLTDQNPMVQLCAIEILAEKGGEAEIQLLEALADSGESTDELLEAIGDAVFKIDQRLSEKK